MSVSSVQMAYRLARAASGVNAASTTHSLRHSYATHLLEEGVSLLQISKYLGHESLETTVIYTHLTAISEARVKGFASRGSLPHRMGREIMGQLFLQQPPPTATFQIPFSSLGILFIQIGFVINQAPRPAK